MVAEGRIRKIKKREDAAQRIRWMFTRKSTTESGEPGRSESRVPWYGDLTSLNTSRLILDSVGASLLSDVAGDFVEMLDTSCAVYERNGDYALGVLTSSWCQFMDQASRRLCDTPDNRKAMKSGKWHCHESCWKDAALRAIETNEPVDVACRGGVRLLAVPIYAGKEIVGGISVGYGDPPRDSEKLLELAAVYGVSGEDLRRQAEAYDTRPSFIIELAKRRLLRSARLIGGIVERELAMERLRQSEGKFRTLFNLAKDAIFIHDMEGHMLEVNQEACERLGYSHDEFLKMSLRDIIAPEQTVQITERVETLRRQGYHLFESVHRRRNGTLIPVEVSVRLFESTGGQLFLSVCRDITERKQAEAALRKSEEKFRSLVETTSDWVWEVDKTGGYTYSSPKIRDLLGYEPEEVLGKTPFDFMPPAERERVARIFQDAVRLKTPLNSIENTNIHKSGQNVALETNAVPILDQDGNLLGYRGIDRDITKRKQAEAALAESEKRFSVFMEHLPAGVFMKDQAGRLLFANRYLDELFGWRECIGKTTGELLPQEVTDRMIADDRKVLTEGPTVIQERITDIHGAERFFDTYKFPIEVEGSPALLAGIAVDITERKRAEEALEKRIVALTQPLDAENIAFEDLFNLSDLQRLADLTAEAWGVAALITRPDGTPITQPSNFSYLCSEFIRKTEKGFRKCQISDAMLGRYNPSGPTIHRCLSAGLCGAGASITVGGRHIANWLIGQVRNEAQSEEQMMEYAREIGADETAFREAFLKVPVMPQEKFEQIAHALFALANQISTSAYQNIQQARFIAERKQAEEAFRESERKLSEAQKIAQLGYWTWDVRTGDVEWSEEVFRIFRLDPSSFTPQIDSILALSPWPEDHERDKELIQKAIESKERGTYEQRFLRPDNSIGYYFSSFEGQYDDNGNLAFIVGTVQDITERRRAEEGLRESEAKFRGIYEASPIGIELYDREGALLDINRACLDIFGISDAKAVKGFKLFEDPNLSEELKAQLRKGESVRYEMPFDFGKVSTLRLYETKKSGIIYLDVLITPLRDGKKDSAIGYLLHIRDITEPRQAEEERRKIEVQMREVQRLESLGVMAGGIAHDFNNLLMAILGRADLALLSIPPTSPACRHVEEIKGASERAADLCRQMLAYSGKGRFVVSRHDISEIVREMGQILDVSVSKKAMIRYSLAKGLPAVESDATQIRQVIMNLITNASEALADAKGIITVTTGVMECDETYLSESYLDDHLSKGTYVYIEVSDTGCGMDVETRSRIFDPFFTTKFTGRGLGLAAVLGIVRGHKGAIKVYSEVGKGTTFKILLPAVEWGPGERVKTLEQSASVQAGGTLLLVDDDASVRSVASEMLAQLGFQVLTAINGREGLEVFRAHRGEIACVILDLTMPEMGGEEVFRELRALRSDIRVILSSGYNEQDVTQRFVGRGLSGFIQKPYTMANLRSALKRALG